MQTTCHHCKTLYSINQAELDVADGDVICSVCNTKFNAYDSLEGYQDDDDSAVSVSNRRTYLVLAIILMLLSAQYIYFEKDQLLKQPFARNIAQMVCSVAGCHVPAFKDVSKIKLINRKVHSHPVENAALIITATVINNATQAQPFPKILISMADVHGKVHAQRLFSPADYLPENISEEQNMAAGIPININLEIEDPGQNLIAFEIDFL